MIVPLVDYPAIGRVFFVPSNSSFRILMGKNNLFGQLGNGHTDFIDDDAGEFANSEGPVAYQ